MYPVVGDNVNRVLQAGGAVTGDLPELWECFKNHTVVVVIKVELEAAQLVRLLVLKVMVGIQICVLQLAWVVVELIHISLAAAVEQLVSPVVMAVGAVLVLAAY